MIFNQKKGSNILTDRRGCLVKLKNNNWIQKKINVKRIIEKNKMNLRKMVQNNFKDLIIGRKDIFPMIKSTKLIFPMLKSRIKKNNSIIPKY